MKKNLLVIVAMLFIGAATFTVNSLIAQNDTPPAAPPAAQAPPPGPRPLPPGLRGRRGNSFAVAVQYLRRAKAELERSKEDYDGHRQSAMDACDKALKELEAVQESIRASAAAAAQNAQQAPTPAPAPPQ